MQYPHTVTTLEQLEALYPPAGGNSLAKETAGLTPAYRRWIERAPFFALASAGPEGLDCTPRGDAVGGLVRVVDEKTILLPDRRGNNRIDTLRNIVRDPRVALLFLIPGIDECLRINGNAAISTAPEMLALFETDGKPPVTVICVEIEAVYFQCARALKRSRLWDPEVFAAKGEVPSAGEMIKDAQPAFDGDAYDAELPSRQSGSLY